MGSELSLVSDDPWEESDVDGVEEIFSQTDVPVKEHAGLEDTAVGSKSTNNTSFTWSCVNSPNEFFLYCYIFNSYIDKTFNNITVVKEMTSEFGYDVDKSSTILIKGTVAFIVGAGRIVLYTPNIQGYSCTIESNVDISDIIDDFKQRLKNDNPLRGKHLQITGNESFGFHWIMKSRPDTSFQDVILGDTLKNDIHDNSIYHMDKIGGYNGIILHGPPGTGKSHLCQAIISEALAKGYSSCFITRSVDFTKFIEFVEKFLSPCVVVFEDIDSFGGSRLDGQSSYNLADFLQMMSGLTDSKESIVFIATTNYLHKLDEAISSRPIRFNRKFEFKYPLKEEIDALIELYFRGMEIPQEQKRLCHGLKFTGAHIKEIKRTAKLLSLKSGQTIQEVFPEAVALVKANFSLTFKAMGFGVKKQQEEE